MKPTPGTIRKNRTVESHATRNAYPITGVRLYGKTLEPGSKEYEEFLLMSPRCVTIAEKQGEGVLVSVP